MSWLPNLEAAEAAPVGTHRTRCAHCRKRGRDEAVAITRHEDCYVWFCHRCGDRGAKNFFTNAAPMPRSGGLKKFSTKQARPKKDASPSRPLLPQRGLAEAWKAFWDACRPIEGDAARYLMARGCWLPPAHSHLRCCGDAVHPVDGFRGPALVALITDVETFEPLSLHRTWVRPDGTKRGSRPRMLLKDHAIAGGIIRLWDEFDDVSTLVVAEGIETALSFAHERRPVWSTVDAGHMAALPVLDCVDHLIIAADNDAAGIKAANACAARWKAAGKRVSVAVPPDEGSDWNDVRRRA